MRSKRRSTCSTSGKARVAEKLPGATGPNSWKVNQWLKKAVLLSFRLNDNALIEGGPGQATWWDKVPSKMEGWGENRFKDAGFRAVPGAIVRRSAFIARDVVLMPSFVNLGAYVDEKTMVDTWVTVGSCAQIGKNVHLSGGVGIGGVLEPLQANPTIIEDDCFIGARSEVVEGVIVGQGSVLSMGVFISASTKVIDRDDRQGSHRPRAALFGGGAGLAARQAPARRFAGTLALLRRDREDRRRPDAGENGDQRAFEGVKGKSIARGVRIAERRKMRPHLRRSFLTLKLDNRCGLASYPPQGCFAGGGRLCLEFRAGRRAPLFGGVLALLAALAAPSSARADVTEVFNLFGEFDNSSVLSGTVTIDVTNGSATAIDASASGFAVQNITSQGPQFTEYVVRAASAGNTDQLYLAFGVGSLLGYGGSSFSPDTQINGTIFLKGGGANPSESSPVPEPSYLGPHHRRLHRSWLLRRSPRRKSLLNQRAALADQAARIEPGFRAGALAPGSRRAPPDAAKKNSPPLLYENQNLCYMFCTGKITRRSSGRIAMRLVHFLSRPTEVRKFFI